jgi:hypothetical protein
MRATLKILPDNCESITGSIPATGVRPYSRWNWKSLEARFAQIAKAQEVNILATIVLP